MRIGITQRVAIVESYGETRDCLDQQWFYFLESLNFTPVPIPNKLDDVVQWVESLSIDGLIFSGGNDLAHLPNATNVSSDRDRVEGALLTWAKINEIPVVGVCRGLQMINFWLGGSLIEVASHNAIRHSLLNAYNADEIFQQFSEVNSFHNWGVSPAGLATQLKPQAYSYDGLIEAFMHCSLPWAGIMWHPERENHFNENDKKLFKFIFRGKS